MKSGRPLLQVALDTLTTEEALKSLEPIHPYIDIIEVGTILLAAEGVRAIKVIREHYPDKIVVADGKVADAGKTFSELFFGSGANLLTCICAAETATIAECVKRAEGYPHPCEVQVELTSHFSLEQAREWREVGVGQVVYHRARDAQAAGKSWGDGDLKMIRELTDLGFKVTVTGGLVPEDIKLFKGLDVYIFVGGRSLRDGDDPAQAARLFQEEISRY